MRNHFLRAKGIPAATGIVTQDLVFHIDAGNSSCYSGSGDDVNDLIDSSRTAGEINDATFTAASGSEPAFFSNTITTTGKGIWWGYSDDWKLAADDDEETYANDCSIEFWFRPDSFGSGWNSIAWLCRKGLVTTWRKAWEVSMANQNTAGLPDSRIFIFMGRHWYYSTYEGSTALISLGKYDGDNYSWWENGVDNWYHYVYTWDLSASTFKLYVDGSLISDSSDANEMTRVWWGDSEGFLCNPANGWSSSGNYEHGLTLLGTTRTSTTFRKIDADLTIFRLYKGRCLSASEVTQNYNEEKSRFPGH